MTDVSQRGGKRWWRQESGSEMVWKNDIDRLCRLSSNEFKPATDKIVKYGEPRMRLTNILSWEDARVPNKWRWRVNSYCRLTWKDACWTTQGSVATHLRCGGIDNNIKYIIASFLLNLMVKEFWKLVSIWRNCGQEYSVSFFLTRGVVCAFLWHTI